MPHCKVRGVGRLRANKPIITGKCAGLKGAKGWEIHLSANILGVMPKWPLPFATSQPSFSAPLGWKVSFRTRAPVTNEGSKNERFKDLTEGVALFSSKSALRSVVWNHGSRGSGYPAIAALIAITLSTSGCRSTRVDPLPSAGRKMAAPSAKGEVKVTSSPDLSKKVTNRDWTVPSAKATSVVQEHAAGQKGAVSSAEGNASQVGLQVLKEGGNAVDAAVAVAFALSVTHPNAGNIGGGGFMIISTPNGKHYALDYREQAPGASTPDMYLDAQKRPTQKSTQGPLAAGIPGDVAGLGAAHARFGSLPWPRLLAPAIALARKGWVLDTFHADDLDYGASQMSKLGYQKSAALFRRPDGKPFQAGDTFTQPALADTLQTIADKGWQAFYQGPLARKIVKEQRALGGNWTIQDLQSYEAIWREPIVSQYRGHEVISMPPPSAGGVVLTQILKGAEQHQMYKRPWDSPERAHLYAEIVRRAYVERNQRLGDPKYIDRNWKEMLSTDYVRKRMQKISFTKASKSASLAPPIAVKESNQTTHFSVVDDKHLAVANTFTLNGNFGAKVALIGTGIVLNNEMDDFTVKVGEPNMFGLVQGAQNAIAPGKRMMSSMTPTIVKINGKLRAVLGSPGGSTITTTVAQILLQLVDHQTTLKNAVRAPRMHHQWLPDEFRLEQGVPEATSKALQAKGHQIYRGPRIGHANCIEVGRDGKTLHAVADTTRDGGHAAAY